MMELVAKTITQTLVELLPFLAIIAVEFVTNNFDEKFDSQLSYHSAEDLPTFDGDSRRNVIKIATFSALESSTSIYVYYLVVVISVIFISKFTTIFFLGLSTTEGALLIALMALFWAISVLLSFRVKESSEGFYSTRSGINYYNYDGRDPYYERGLKIPYVLNTGVKWDKADILVLNIPPIIFILIINTLILFVRV